VRKLVRILILIIIIKKTDKRKKNKFLGNIAASPEKIQALFVMVMETQKLDNSSTLKSKNAYLSSVNVALQQDKMVDVLRRRPIEDRVIILCKLLGKIFEYFVNMIPSKVFFQ
jgi:hypothetical protein